MKSRLLVAMLTLAVVPFLSTAQEKKDAPVATDNPFKNVDKGDSATYTVTTKIGTLSMTGTMTQTVTAKTDKEVTLSIDGTVNTTTAIPAQAMVIDLTKPYDPTKGTPIPGLDANVKRDKAPTAETVRVTVKDGTPNAVAKEFKCMADTYKLTAKAQGVPFDATLKVWQSTDAKFGVVKLELTAEVNGNKIDFTMELAEVKKVNLDAKKEGN